MTDLERLVATVPALQGLGAEVPYLRLHRSDGVAAIDADVEWSDDQGEGALVQIAVTEWDGGRRRPLLAAVFRAGNGLLAASGPTVSLAKPVTERLHAEMVVQSLVEQLEGLWPVEARE